jgi:DNA processing protein
MAVEHGRQVILTDQVVNGNEWARALVGRAGVHTAGSVAAVMNTVEDIVNMWDQARSWMNG